ncbi:MAG: response regulator [Pelosinus sp.]|nr:response regulator [Pelosinus sp.]
MRLVIIDDDAVVRKIISNIVEKYELGTIVAECADGLRAEQVITEYQPEIALVDLLLPGQDGVKLITSLKQLGADTSFIMISQSSSQDMITEAYKNGIDFYIHKPINVLEFVSVFKKVEESRRLRAAMSLISQTTALYNKPSVKKPEVETNTDKRAKIFRIFSELGIIGEAGVENIYHLILEIEKRISADAKKSYHLHEIYQRISETAGQDVKTIEQRVRRTLAKALHNMATTGIDDYYNDKFQQYSGTLFEFKEVRQEMAFIQGKSTYRGKLNIRKFLESIIFLANE